ncbi:MAG: hypothetical protein M3209_08225 [Acidobacteriota bacterium]|nr:hypothetical protein [Acidobacteriota bacterium]
MPDVPNVPIARIRNGGGQPIVEIFIGNAHWAKYEIWHRDQGGQAKRIGFGVNSDNIPDVAPVADPINTLHGDFIFWRAAIADPSGSPGANYIVTVRVVQDGNVVGMDARTGPLTGTPVYGFIRLAVV